MPTALWNALWATMSHYDPIWPTMSHCYEPLWAAMSHYEPLYATMSHYDLLWPAMSHYYEPLWATMKHYEPLWAITMSHHEPLWATMTNYEPLWASMNHYEPLRATVSHYYLPSFSTRHQGVKRKNDYISLNIDFPFSVLMFYKEKWACLTRWHYYFQKDRHLSFFVIILSFWVKSESASILKFGTMTN